MNAHKPAAIAILVSQHPAINHAVILREIRELRKLLELRTASIRGPDRPLDQLSAEERDEATCTFFVKAQGAGGAFTAGLTLFFTRPASFIAGLFYTVKLSRFRPGQMLKNLGYFAEALIVGRWMQRENLHHLHSHYSSTVALLVKFLFPIGLSISFHGPDELSDPAGFWLREKIEACDFVRAISYYARSQLMLCCDPAHWNKIEVSYMAVDPDVFTPNPFREAPMPLEVICVGRLAPVKAQRVLIAATAKLVEQGRSVRLHIVGGGPDRQSLEQEVDALGIRPSVIFYGFTPQDKLEELYRKADVFALPSFAEGLPGVLMEAMAMEIPSVSTGITGVPELIRDGVDGLLVAPADAGALAAAIASLIDDSVFRRRIAKAGRLRVLDKFSLAANARRLADIFERHAQSGR